MQLEYFRMIDRVVSVDAGAITAEAVVPEASPVFEGHFPGHPLVPGVLLLETMAQAAGYLLLARLGFARMAFLIGSKELKLRRFVRPGERLSVTARLVHEGSGYSVADAAITSADQRICEVREMKFSLQDFPAPELAGTMRAQAARIGLGT
ncbi:3-hydroxyacyl-ACP dehydratase FabZ family protein [Belnapia sp. F-4-1]|uniref:3-hydroxyacyl-ACP dehydratase FabZ family protein n=1 Tax=Belnapia sp. F-4-1 TaxID=1545443 RepID=UPI0005B795E1|nr:3-hydroxyacyl-ACP dehydratase FabZ family protein [Belnapia sp. F-4-1]